MTAHQTAGHQVSDHGSPDLAGATIASRGKFPREGGEDTPGVGGPPPAARGPLQGPASLLPCERRGDVFAHTADGQTLSTQAEAGKAGHREPPAPRASGGTQHYAPWLPHEAEKLRRLWPNPNILNEDLPGHLGRTLCAIRAKAQLMRLGKRPVQCDGKRRAAAQRRLLQEMRKTHRHRIDALQAEAVAPVEPVAPGLRETDRLVRARMLVQRGISVASIISGLKLTSVEVAALKGDA